MTPEEQKREQERKTAASNRKVLGEYLTDEEQKALQKIVDSPIYVEALRKIFLWEMNFNGTLIKGKKTNPDRNSAFLIVTTNQGITNEEAGAKLRAMVEGVSFIEAGFNVMKAFSKENAEKRSEDTSNPAV